MTLDEAFANLEPEEGDQIETMNDYAEYYGEWIGFDTQQTLKPGEGFLYYSFSEEAKTFVFPMSSAKGKAVKPIVKPIPQGAAKAKTTQTSKK